MKTKNDKTIPQSGTGSMPDMTKEQRAELRKLDAQEKKITRAIEKIDRAAWQADRRAAKRIGVCKRVAAINVERFERRELANTKKYVRARAAESKALRRLQDAIERRRDIVMRRLES